MVLPADVVHEGAKEEKVVENVLGVSFVLDEVRRDEGKGVVLVRDGVDMEDIGVLFVE